MRREQLFVLRPIAFLLVFLLCQFRASAQQKRVPRTLVAGQFAHHFDYFWTNDYVNGDAIYERPSHLHRLSINLQIAKGKFNLPIQALLTAPFHHADRHHQGPSNLRDYLSMPGTILGMQPGFRKLKLYLGSHAAGLSSLTAGNIDFTPLAGGMEFTPSKFCFKASYGIVQRYLAPYYATPLSFQGLPERRMLTAKVGVGNQSRSHLLLNLANVHDSAGANTLMSLQYQLRGDSHLFWRGEIALSADHAPPTIANPLDIGAMESQIGLRFKNLDLDLKGVYVGPHYVSLAIYNQVRGYLDLTASLRLTLFKSCLQLYGMGGFRRNGIAVPIEVSDQALLNANGSLQLTKRMGFEAHYFNYGWQQPLLMDANLTLQPAVIRQTTASLGGNAHVRLGKANRHVFSATYSRDRYLDAYINPPSAGSTVNAELQGANYQLTTQKHRGLTLGANRFDTDRQVNANSPVTQLQWNAYAGLQRYFFKTRLQTLLQLQFSLQDLGNPAAMDTYLLTFTASTKFLSRRLHYTVQTNARIQNQPTGPIQMAFIRQSLVYRF